MEDFWGLQSPQTSLICCPMAKRPTPKKRKPKSDGRRQHSVYLLREIKRLRGRMNSPYGVPAESKDKADKALESITRIKA